MQKTKTFYKKLPGMEFSHAELVRLLYESESGVEDLSSNNSEIKKGQIITRSSRGSLVRQWCERRNVVYITTEFSNKIETILTTRGE